MTLREEFEKYVDGWNNLSVEKLFKSSNKEYIKWLEDKYKEECKELEDYDESDLVRELKSRNFDFIEEVEDHEMIEYLESVGTQVFDENFTPADEQFVDHNDLIKLDEIRTKFLNASWSERESIYNKIINDSNSNTSL